MMKTSIVTVWLFLVAGVLCAAPAAQPKTPSGDKQPKAAAKPAPRPQAPAKAEPRAFSRAEGEVFESPAAVTPVNEIDRLVLPRLAALKIKPVLCSDAVFVRRAYIDVIGVLPTMYDPRTLHSREVLSTVQQAFGDLVFTTVIHRTVKFPDAAVAGEPITAFAPGSSGAEAYRQLAREVLAR